MPGSAPIRFATTLIRRRRTRRFGAAPKAIGALLLDQSIVAGAGLVYVSEVLFRAGIPPTLPGRDLIETQWNLLWTDLCALMRKGVATGRIDTVRDEHLPEVTGTAAAGRSARR